MSVLFKLSSYDYTLPEELIAKEPKSVRSASRLLVVDRLKGSFEERSFADLPNILNSQDALFFNDSKVIKARLFGRKTTGAAIEILLLRQSQEKEWEALLKPGRKCPVGTEIEIGEGFVCHVVEELLDGKKRLCFEVSDFWGALERFGEIPLPHYMERKASKGDEERYQTVYAGPKGSVAAPTAGLHFTKELLEELDQKGIERHQVTLHVGWGTFKPVQTESILDHRMHSEPYSLKEEAYLAIRSTKKRRIAVGTTSLRVMESAEALSGETSIFIYPGYVFKHVDALITNFHLPRSTLLMLVSAFGGYELIQKAYQYAIDSKFKFYSYGDSMLIV